MRLTVSMGTPLLMAKTAKLCLVYAKKPHRNDAAS